MSSLYDFEQDDVRDELPQSISDIFVGDNIADNTDLVNYTLALGYYVSNDLSLRLSYTEGLEIGRLDNVFSGVFSNLPFIKLDLSIVELDATYHFYHINDSLSTFALGGIAVSQLDARVENRNNNETISSDDETDIGFKLGVGLQWDFSDNWGLKLGYTYFDFLSTNKTYLQLEYRF